MSGNNPINKRNIRIFGIVRRNDSVISWLKTLNKIHSSFMVQRLLMYLNVNLTPPLLCLIGILIFIISVLTRLILTLYSLEEGEEEGERRRNPKHQQLTAIELLWLVCVAI